MSSNSYASITLGVVRILGAKLPFNVLTHRIFVKKRANFFQIIPRIKEHIRKQNDSQDLNVPRATVH